MKPIRKAKRGVRPSDVSDKKIWECVLCHSRFKTKGGLDDHQSAKHRHTQAPEIIRAPTCLECGRTARLTDGRELYPHRPDLYHKFFYKCECGAYCGCHDGTKRALGNPAGMKTRQARMRAHDAFDPIWRNRPVYGLSRRDVYKLAADALHIPASDCHIGMMNVEMAERLTRWAYDWRAEFHGKKI